MTGALVRQRTNLARLSTISHDFYTTSDAFKNKKVYIYAFLIHGYFLIRPHKRNKYDFTAMTVQFSTHFCTFLGGMHTCPPNATIIWCSRLVSE